MTKIEKNGKLATKRAANSDGSVMVFFDDSRKYKTFATEAAADRALTKYFAA